MTRVLLTVEEIVPKINSYHKQLVEFINCAVGVGSKQFLVFLGVSHVVGLRFEKQHYM